MLAFMYSGEYNNNFADRLLRDVSMVKTINHPLFHGSKDRIFAVAENIINN